MKVAIIGSGFVGLAVCFYLEQGGADVTVFDHEKGASFASSGLLHKYVGKKGEKNIDADEAFEEAFSLLTKASARRPVFEQSGILRFAQTEEQKELFSKETIWIKEGITVYSIPYLQELKGLCTKSQFIKKRIDHVQELDSFDLIVIAAGAQSTHFFPCPIRKSIGQSLLCKVKEKIPHAMLFGGHITPTENPEYCQIGATYEHGSAPDPKKALALLEQAISFYPPAKDFTVCGIRSGVRIGPKEGYLPICQKVGPKIWTLFGFGSRGLLYHALYAKRLACQLLFSEKEGYTSKR